MNKINQYLKFGILTLFLTQISHAQLHDNYTSGRKLCSNVQQSIKNEVPYWVTIPVDYSDSNQGKSEIYAYSLKPINKKNPYLLFFAGGPGASSRQIRLNLLNTNVIYLEQRGVSCSRPSKYSNFIDPSYYSSENTARDALAVIDYLNINRISVYGHSYGTVPATIFASLFPERTSNLIVEGTIYHANFSLIQSKRRQKLLQKLFNSLDERTQNQIIDLSKGTLKTWFSKVSFMMLSLNNGLRKYKHYLKKLLDQPDKIIQRDLGNFYFESNRQNLLYYSKITESMITCQETAYGSSDINPTLIFNKKGKLIFDESDRTRSKFCRPVNLYEVNNKSRIYHAKKYPVLVPTYYFLGETDGSTDLDQGLNHFYNVPQGEKKMLILRDGGHIPNLGHLKNNRDCRPTEKNDYCKSLRINQLQSKFFNEIIHNNKINQHLLNRINKENLDGQWILLQ